MEAKSLPSDKVPLLSPAAFSKPPWKDFDAIQLEAHNEMIRKMASANYKSVGPYTQIKICRMLEQLNTTEINLDLVRVLCYNGIIDDCRGLRSTVWKLILFHLPPDATAWTGKMEEKLLEYQKLRAQLIPGLIPTDLAGEKTQLWEDVEKDIKRTRSDVAFFMEPVDKALAVDHAALYDLAQFRKAELTPEQQKSYVMTHGDVLGRMLFIYGCRHMDVRYVQGMNEILAVIYYLFAKDCIQGCEKYMESDAFFVFENLMCELKDWFNSKMDNEPTGVRAQLKQIAELVERMKKPVWKVMQDRGLDITIFTIRWQMLLLCQDFHIPDVLRLWDSLLSDMARFNFFAYVCLALIVNVEEEIMTGEFDTIVHAINDSPAKIEMKDLIQMAKKLLAEDIETNSPISSPKAGDHTPSTAGPTIAVQIRSSADTSSQQL